MSLYTRMVQSKFCGKLNFQKPVSTMESSSIYIFDSDIISKNQMKKLSAPKI